MRAVVVGARLEGTWGFENPGLEGETHSASSGQALAHPGFVALSKSLYGSIHNQVISEEGVEAKLHHEPQ